MEPRRQVIACVSPYLTGIFLSAAVSGAKHSGSDQVAVGANACFLADQADIHLLKHIIGAA